MNTDVVSIQNPQGKSPVLLVCEHASNHIPAQYNDLGLSKPAIQSHIAWDPGALHVAQHLMELLDAPLVSQKISRLVYDCNRPPDSPDAMRATSEVYQIPGNENLGADEIQARIDAVYTPFRNTLRQTVDQRITDGFDPVIITIHSFTPEYNGKIRDVEIGILHDSDSRLADKMLATADTRFRIQRNAPYGPADGVTHTLLDQAISRGLQNVMIEIRNDLLESPQARREVANWLAALITKAPTPEKEVT
ncbi:MAG: N-formylglutamate amidohydrolase [Rhodobacteraceae bacterium]|nr:N-formylglutamate amidohydrolase [Paracoccaceae bacterium]